MHRMMMCHAIGAFVRFEYMLRMAASMPVRNAGRGEVDWTGSLIQGWAREDGTQLCYTGKDLRRGASG